MKNKMCSSASIFFLLLFIISAGCKSGSSGPAITSVGIQDILPLSVGNQWVLGITEYRSDGTVKGAYFDTVNIVGSTTYQGMTAYKLTQMNPDTNLEFYSGPDLITVSRGKAIRALHYPLNVGESYVVIDTTIRGSIQREVLVLRSNSEQITVPAGSFSSVVHIDDLYISGQAGALDTSSIRKQYFAPHVGQIKEDDYGYDQTKNYFLVNAAKLQSYILK